MRNQNRPLSPPRGGGDNLDRCLWTAKEGPEKLTQLAGFTAGTSADSWSGRLYDELVKRTYFRGVEIITLREWVRIKRTVRKREWRRRNRIKNQLGEVNESQLGCDITLFGEAKDDGWAVYQAEVEGIVEACLGPAMVRMLALLLAGHSIRQIAEQLDVSPRTINRMKANFCTVAGELLEDYLPGPSPCFPGGRR